MYSIFIQCVTGGGEGIGGLRQMNTCRQVPLLVNLGFGIVIDIWSMSIRLQAAGQYFPSLLFVLLFDFTLLRLHTPSLPPHHIEILRVSSRADMAVGEKRTKCKYSSEIWQMDF